MMNRNDLMCAQQFVSELFVAHLVCRHVRRALKHFWEMTEPGLVLGGNLKDELPTLMFGPHPTPQQHREQCPGYI